MITRLVDMTGDNNHFYFSIGVGAMANVETIVTKVMEHLSVEHNNKS